MSGLADFPPGTDPEPCWEWTGPVRSQSEKLEKRGIHHYRKVRRRQPILAHGLSVMREMFRIHGLDPTVKRWDKAPTCHELCVNPFHRVERTAPSFSDGSTVTGPNRKLMDDIKAYLPQAKDVDDVYEHFAAQLYQEDQITRAMEALRDENSKPS